MGVKQKLAANEKKDIGGQKGGKVEDIEQNWQRGSMAGEMQELCGKGGDEEQGKLSL